MGERTDRELLELAARAAGVPEKEGGGYMYAEVGELHAVHFGIVTWLAYGNIRFWNPLTDDGDALRLAVKLGMHIYCDFETMSGRKASRTRHYAQDGDVIACEAHAGDPGAATRRAITRAAAAIGSAIESGEERK